MPAPEAQDDVGRWLQALQRGGEEGEAMTRPEALEAIHRALRSQGIEDRDVHEYLDWIEDATQRDWRTWWMLSAGIGLLGLVAGAAACWLLR